MKQQWIQQNPRSNSLNVDITTDFHNVKLTNKRTNLVLAKWKEIMSHPVPFFVAAIRNMSGIKTWKTFSGSNQPTIYLTTGYHETEKEIAGCFVAIDVRHICLCVVFRWWCNLLKCNNFWTLCSIIFKVKHDSKISKIDQTKPLK